MGLKNIYIYIAKIYTQLNLLFSVDIPHLNSIPRGDFGIHTENSEQQLAFMQKIQNTVNTEELFSPPGDVIHPFTIPIIK
jgi:hypothetical protein